MKMNRGAWDPQMRTGGHQEASGGGGGRAEPGKGPPRQEDRLGEGHSLPQFPLPPPRIVSNKCLGLDSKPRGQLTR